MAAAPWWSPWQQQRRPANAGKPGVIGYGAAPGPTIDPRAFLQMLAQSSSSLVPQRARQGPPLDRQGLVGRLPQSPAAQVAAALGGVSLPAVSMPAASNIGEIPRRAANNIFNTEQGGNEPYWKYQMRLGVGAPFRAVDNVVRSASEGMLNTFGGLGATPNSAADTFFATAIVGQESGGRQVDAQGNPLVGRDRQGRVPGAGRGGPAIGAAQIQEATARNTAKQHGIAWDPARWKNDKQYNLELGRLHFNDLAKAYGGDLQLASAAYHSGEPNVNRALEKHGRAGFVQGLGPEGQNYVQQMTAKLAGLAGNFGAPAPAFDPSPFAGAMAQSNRAAELQAAPFSAAFETTPLPPRPEPVPFTAPDYSAGDTAFEQTRPKNPFDDPKEQIRVKRQQYFKGIGQAMASLSGGEGIGTMLMKLGAGALMGRARGEEMVDERELEFEKSLQEFNRALANREDQKAAQTANVLNQNIQQRNAFADTLWSDNVKQIEKFQPQVVGDRLITYTTDPENPNKKIMNSVQIGFGPQAEAALRNANITMSMGAASAESARYAHSSGQATARTALGMAVSTALAQNDGQAVGEGILTQANLQARAAVQTGSWRNFFADSRRANEHEATATERAYAAVGHTNPAIPLEGSKATLFRQAFEDAMTDIIYSEAMRLGQIDKLLTNSAGRNALVTQRTGTQRTTERTGPKGTTTTRSWSLEE